MKTTTNDIVVERQVSDGWAGDPGVTFRNEDSEHIIVDAPDGMAFANEDDLNDFVRITKEMMKGLG